MKNQSFFCNWYLPFSSICCQRVNTARCLHFENRAMKKSVLHIIFPVLFIAAAAVSCSDRTTLMQLESVAAYVGEEPARALSELDSLHQEGISGREANAKYALLYSMALDKNYIDSVDDSLINIAVAWYRHHGNADEKLKAYYYQGRIYQNAGDNESAMESFVKAEQYVGKAEDLVATGLLYTALNDIYTEIFDIESARIYNKKAMDCYLVAGDMDKYAGRLLYASDLYYAEGFYDKADAYLDSVKIVWNTIGENRKINYYSSSMQLKADKGDFTGLQEDLNEYVNFDNEKIFWHDAVYNHVLLGQYAEAADALAQYRKYNSNYRDDPAYYLVSSYLYKSSENFKAALENFEIYSDLSDSLSLVIAEQDTGFIKERYEKELQIERAKNTRNIIITVSAIFLLLICKISYDLRQKLKTRNNEIRIFRENYFNLEKEKAALAKVISDNPPVDSQSMQVLNDRLSLLNKFFAAEITSDSDIDRKACNELSRLVADRDHFMYTTRMTFAAAHPNFVRYLESKGLSEWQIEYCCLYTIGLKGKDIGNYIKKKRHYIDSSEIREKLGLGEHDTNLGIYLRTLLSEDN